MADPVAKAPFIVPALVDEAGLSVYAFRAFAHIVRRAGPDGLYYGSGTRSASLCKMSLRQWRRAIGELVARSCLAVEAETKGRPTVYRPTPDRCTTVTGDSGAPVTDRHGTGATQAQGSAPQAQVPVTDRHTKESREGGPSRSPGKGNEPSGAVAPAVLTLTPPPTQHRNGNGAATATADPVSWSQEACDAWIKAFGGTAPGGRIGKALRPLVDRHGWDAVRPAWQRYLAEKSPEYATPEDFAARFGLWSKGAGTRSRNASRGIERLRASVEAGLLPEAGPRSTSQDDDPDGFVALLKAHP